MVNDKEEEYTKQIKLECSWQLDESRDIVHMEMYSVCVLFEYDSDMKKIFSVA